MKTQAIIGAALAALTLGSTLSVQASPVISVGKPVTGSPFYNDGSETFTYQNIDDGLLNDTAGPGTAYANGDLHNWSFWLTPDGVSGVGNLGYAVINLQSLYTVNEVDLQNTHNRFYNDRGTDAFDISYSTDGINFTPLLSDAFTTYTTGTTGSPVIPILSETSFAPFTAQYVKFNIDSVYGSSGGLNEMTVHGTPAVAVVPEVGALALLVPGLLPLAVLARRRRAA